MAAGGEYEAIFMTFSEWVEAYSSANMGAIISIDVLNNGRTL